jgi:hypothetical protein
MPALLIACAVAGAEEYEIGAVGGSGFMRSLAVAGAQGTASTGLGPGFAAGAMIGHNLYPRLSGEVRYLFRDSSLQLLSGGVKTTFSGISHLLHYDLLFHAAPSRSKIQPFIAGGGGVRVFRGTGTETAFQALSNFAILTKTQELKPVVAAGAGVKIRVSPRVRFRAEIRDYMSPFPRQVITPVSGASISGWVHDLVPGAGISYIF